MFAFILGILTGAFFYFKVIKPLGFWKERQVKQPTPWPVVGNMGSFVSRTKHMVEIIGDIYRNHQDNRYVGFMHFTRPALIIKDVDLIKQIGVKEFHHFHDHLETTSSNDNLLSKTLLSLVGDDWRRMRATLSPAFTGSKMRNMYHLMSECADNFVNHFKGKEMVAVDMKDIFSRFANDVIATTAFGVKVDSLAEPNHEFYVMGRNLTKFTFKQAVRIFLLMLSPSLARKIGIESLDTTISTFFRSIIKDNIKKRETEGIVRHDMIHLLMEARKGQLKHDTTKDDSDKSFATVEESQIVKNTNQMELTDDDIVAQAVLFFFAGFETASTASCFVAYELAVNPDIQKKLQEEIDAVNLEHHGNPPYEVLVSMKYLDQVVSETLRKWPPGFQTDRICTEEFVIPPKKPGERTLLIEKGVLILIPIMALHRDPLYYPDPDRFDPERFSEENKSKILPGTYMPFGIGPRNCIGSRFALLEIKTLFFHLLTKFDIVAVNETEIPLKLSPKQIFLAPEKGFQLGLKPRKRED